jgi:hypothetical protein
LQKIRTGFLTIGPIFKEINQISHKPNNDKNDTRGKRQGDPAEYQDAAAEIPGNEHHTDNRDKEYGDKYFSGRMFQYLTHFCCLLLCIPKQVIIILFYINVNDFIYVVIFISDHVSG